MKRFSKPKLDWGRLRRGAKLLITHPKPADFSADDEAAMNEVFVTGVVMMLLVIVLRMVFDF